MPRRLVRRFLGWMVRWGWLLCCLDYSFAGYRDVMVDMGFWKMRRMVFLLEGVWRVNDELTHH